MLLEIIWGPSLHWEQNSSKSPVILTRSEKLILKIKKRMGQMPYLHSKFTNHNC